MEDNQKNQNQSDVKTVSEISEERLEEIRQQAKERALLAKHHWIQRGGYVICTSCPNSHAIRVNSDMRLTGIDNGMPKIERRGKQL